MNSYDVVIVGGGAAGLSAGLVLSRVGRRVVIVDAGRPRNAAAAHMHGFLSRDGFPPGELLSVGRSEVKRYGGVLVDGTVISAHQSSDQRFEVQLDDGSVLTARRLLVASGLRDQLPDVPGLAERFGRDVLHCPYCHGHEVRDQRIGVLATGPASLHQAQILRTLASDVIYFVHDTAASDEQREHLIARGIPVVDGDVSEIVADTHLSGVVVDGRLVARDAVFVAPRLVPTSPLLASLGCELDDRGFALVDRTGRTSVAAVWAAGNASNPRAQVITAAGEGSAAAIALNADLIEDDVRDAVAHARSDRPAAAAPVAFAT